MQVKAKAEAKTQVKAKAKAQVKAKAKVGQKRAGIEIFDIENCLLVTVKQYGWGFQNFAPDQLSTKNLGAWKAWGKPWLLMSRVCEIEDALG